MNRIELVQRHPANFFLTVIGVYALGGFVIFADFSFEIELNLVHIRSDSREFVLTGTILADEKQLTDFYTRPNFFLTLAFESIV